MKSGSRLLLLGLLVVSTATHGFTQSGNILGLCGMLSIQQTYRVNLSIFFSIYVYQISREVK